MQNSYDVLLECRIDGTAENIVSLNQIALNDPYYHYLSGSSSSGQYTTPPPEHNPYSSWVRRPDMDYSSTQSDE